MLGTALRIGDRVAVEDPGYTGLLDLLRAMGLVPVPVPVDDDGLDADALGEVLPGCEAVVVTPRAQNPTGAALTADRARSLAAVLAGAPDVLVVEDDHAADIAGDERTVTRLSRRLRVGPGWVSTVLQHLAVALWDAAQADGGLARATTAYAERRAALIDALAGVGVPARGRTGLNVWVPIPEEIPVVRALLERGWAVRAGERYRLAAPPAVRVTVARLDPADPPRLRDVTRTGST